MDLHPRQWEGHIQLRIIAVALDGSRYVLLGRTCSILGLCFL